MTSNLFNIFSTRELALIIWILLLFTVFLVWDKDRTHLREIVRNTFTPKLIIVYLSFIAYLSVTVFLLGKLYFWNISLLKDTIIWIIFSALGILFSLTKVKSASYFSQLIKGSISVTIIVESFVNLYTFSFLSEMILLPCVVFLVMLSSYSEVSAKKNKDHKKAYSCFNYLLASVGLIYLGFALYKTAIEFKTILWVDISKQLILPIILTISSIPYFWGLALYMKYENMFCATNTLFRNTSKIEKLKIKLYTLYYGNFSFRRIHRIWKRISLLAHEERTDYRKYIKQVAAPPTYKKSPIINKMSIQLFNDINACCKYLISLGIGELSEWNQLQYLDEFYCNNNYYHIQPYGLSNLLLSLQGEELHIHQLELSLTIHSTEERNEAISKFKDCVILIFRLLSLQVPESISDSIFRDKSCVYNNDSFSIEFTLEIIGKVELFVLVVRSN